MIKQFVTTSYRDLREAMIDDPVFAQGVRQLQELFGYIECLNGEAQYGFVYDPFIIRGLDYYT